MGNKFLGVIFAAIVIMGYGSTRVTADDSVLQRGVLTLPNGLITTGNVGIGTTDPQAKLEVVGDVKAGGVLYFTGGGVGANRMAAIYPQSGSGFIFMSGASAAGNPYDYIFATGDPSEDSAIRMTIKADGKVGIGKTDPSELLEVAGNIKASGVCIADDCKTSWPTGSGSGTGWADDGVVVRLAEGTDTVGIGTITPKASMHIVSPNTQDNNYGDFTVENIGSTWSLSQFGTFSDTAGHSSQLILRRARGTITVPTAVANGDQIGGVFMRGYDGTAYQQRAYITSFVNGAVSGSTIPVDLVFNTGSTSSPPERMRIKSDGYVGIGTINPTSKLHVYEGDVRISSGTANLNPTLVFDAASAVNIATLISHRRDNLRRWQYGANGGGGTDDLSFWRYGNDGGFLGTPLFLERATGNAIFNDGSVGIGTAAPTAPFEVYRTNVNPKIRSRSKGDGTNFASLSLKSDETTPKDWEITHRQIAPDINKLMFYYNDGTNWNPRMTIDTAGNVGIGTTSPASELEVAATGQNSFIYIDTDTADSGISFQRNNNQIWGLKQENSDDSLRIYGAAPAQTERFIITQAGNVGIGTMDPGAYKLKVAGDISGTKLCIADDCKSAWPTGGGLTPDADGNIAVAGNINMNSKDSQYLLGRMAANDYWKIYGTGASDAGEMIIETGDNANEPFVFRQYSAAGAVDRVRITGGGMEVVGSVKGTQLCIATDCRTAWPSAEGATVGGGWTDAGTAVYPSTASDKVALGTSTPANAGKLTIVDNEAPSATGLDSGGLVLGQVTGASGYSWLQSYGGKPLLINNWNNVGIGVSNPSVKLDVAGTIQANGNPGLILSGYPGLRLSNTNAQIRFYGESGAEKWAMGSTGATGDSFQIYDMVTGNLGLWIDQTNDNVGIGTTDFTGDSAIAGKMVIAGPNQADSVQGGTLVIRTTDATAADVGGSLAFGGMRGPGTTQPQVWAKISGRKDNALAESGGYLSFVTKAQLQNPAERMRITSAGYVGIGTATPIAPLEVEYSTDALQDVLVVDNPNGNSNTATGLRWQNGGNQMARLYAVRNNNEFIFQNIQTGSTAGFTFKSGSTDVLRITSGGNVGIGTLTPTVKTHVYDAVDGTFTGLAVDNRKTYGAGTGTNEISRLILSLSESDATDPLNRVMGSISAGTESETDSSNGFMALGTRTSGTETEKIRITSTGSVGIGVTNPGTSKLKVAGTIESSSGGFKFPDGSVQTSAATAAAASGWTRDGTNGEIELATATDKVGIGTASPIAKLEVAGSVYISGGSGDVNDNGVTNSVDVSLISQYLEGTTTFTATQMRNADVDGDNQITPKDGQVISYQSAGYTREEAKRLANKVILINGEDVGIGATGNSKLTIARKGTTGAQSDILFRSTTTGDANTLYTGGRMYAKFDGVSSIDSRITFQNNIIGTLTDVMTLKAGNVGIGTTSPASWQTSSAGVLDVIGSGNSGVMARFWRGASEKKVYLAAGDNAWGGIGSEGNLYLRAGVTGDNPYGTGKIVSIASDGTLTVDGGTGKINAGTIDPIYTIGGVKYATYLPGMTGVKEETTGAIILKNKNQNNEYYYEIDFNSLEAGSDLWLFGKTTDILDNFDQLAVLLTPSFNGKVWYTKDQQNKKLRLFAQTESQTDLEISYRLTAPRFDHTQWSNYADSDHDGFNLDEK